MRRIAAGVAVLSVVAFTGCYPFPHSDYTLNTCSNSYGGWSSAACGDALCYDWHNAYGWDRICPIEIEYATGPR